MSEKHRSKTFVELLDNLGKTQTEIANYLGVRQATISDWYRGKAIPHLTPLQYVKLIELIGCTPEELAEAFHKGECRQLAA